MSFSKNIIELKSQGFEIKKIGINKLDNRGDIIKTYKIYVRSLTINELKIALYQKDNLSNNLLSTDLMNNLIINKEVLDNFTEIQLNKLYKEINLITINYTQKVLKNDNYLKVIYNKINLNVNNNLNKFDNLLLIYYRITNNYKILLEDFNVEQMIKMGRFLNEELKKIIETNKKENDEEKINEIDIVKDILFDKNEENKKENNDKIIDKLKKIPDIFNDNEKDKPTNKLKNLGNIFK